MEKQEVLNKVADILCESVRLNRKDVILESELGDDLGLDSLDVVNASLMLEDEFTIVFNNQEVADLTTVKSLVDLIISKEN